MKRLPVERQTVDMTTGKVVETKTVSFGILPPPPGACPVCGRNPAHAEDQPHDAQQLFYHYAFYGEHGRWPTWRDAVAHCSDHVKSLWEAHLRNVGAWPEERD